MSGWPVLRRGDSHLNVRTLQYLLNHTGSQLEADGIFGSLTEEAVRSFQRDGDLQADGIVAESSWRRLLPTLAMGDRSEAVKGAQVQLLWRRTLAQVDGIFGMKTDISVRRFQVLKRLPVDGMVGPDTWREMLADEFVAPPGPDGGEEVDPSDWRAQLLSKLRPGGPGPGDPPGLGS